MFIDEVWSKGNPRPKKNLTAQERLERMTKPRKRRKKITTTSLNVVGAPTGFTIARDELMDPDEQMNTTRDPLSTRSFLATPQLTDNPAPISVTTWEPFSRDGIEGYIKPVIALYDMQKAQRINGNTHPRGPVLKMWLKDKIKKKIKSDKESYKDRGGHLLQDGYLKQMPELNHWYLSQEAPHMLRARYSVLFDYDR